MVEVNIQMLSLFSERLEFSLMNLRNGQKLDGLYLLAKLSSYLTLAPRLNGADEVP